MAVPLQAGLAGQLHLHACSCTAQGIQTGRLSLPQHQHFLVVQHVVRDLFRHANSSTARHAYSEQHTDQHKPYRDQNAAGGFNHN
jgi:hypothetical protein